MYWMPFGNACDVANRPKNGWRFATLIRMAAVFSSRHGCLAPSVCLRRFVLRLAPGCLRNHGRVPLPSHHFNIKQKVYHHEWLFRKKRTAEAAD
jgi:hypothetical protein